MRGLGEHSADQAEHAPVLYEYRAYKGLDTPTPGFFSKPAEKQLPHSLRLPPVFYDDCHLGVTAVPEPHVHGVADDLLSCDGDEESLVVLIHVQHEGQRPLRHVRVRYVEPPVDGLGRDAGEHSAQPLSVPG